MHRGLDKHCIATLDLPGSLRKIRLLYAEIRLQNTVFKTAQYSDTPYKQVNGCNATQFKFNSYKLCVIGSLLKDALMTN